MFRFPRSFSRTKCIPEEIVKIPLIDEILQNSSGVRNEVNVAVLSHPKIPRLSLRCLLKYKTRKSKIVNQKPRVELIWLELFAFNLHSPSTPLATLGKRGELLQP